MNILTDQLPETVLVAGQEHKINTDFRVSIRFEEMIQDKNITEEQRFFMEELLKYSGKFDGDE